MNRILTYWIWLSIYVFLPMLLLLIFKRPMLRSYWRTIILCGIGSLIVAFFWDYFAIRAGLWWFPPENIIGIWFFGLPIEEWIFISFIGMEIAMMALVFAGAGNKGVQK